MNHIYGLVWNCALHTLQAVSEIAVQRGAGGASAAAAAAMRRRPLAATCLAVFGSVAFVGLPAYAGTPVSPQAAAATTCTWSGGNGDWNVAASWVDCNNTFPGTGASAGSGAVVVGATATINSSGLTVGDLTVGNTSGTGSTVEATSGATNDSFTTVAIDSGSTFGLDSGAQVSTTGAVTNNAGGTLNVDTVGVGGSTLAIGGDLSNASTVNVGGGVGMTSPAMLTVGGTLTNTGGTVNIDGGATGVVGEMKVAGAAPSTLTGTYNLLSFDGTALLQYGSGGITQIGDGANNQGTLTLNGEKDYVEIGDTNSNSALTGLNTIASNGTLNLMVGASVTTNGALTNDGQLWVDSSGSGGSSLSVGGNLSNARNIQVGDGFGMTSPSNLTVGGTFTNTGGTTNIDGGAAGVLSEIDVAGAAPTTLEGNFNLLSFDGTAVLNYGTGNPDGITQIGDGGSNGSELTLNGANDFVELGGVAGNSALTHLATIANNGSLNLLVGASVTTSGSLTNHGQLWIDSSGSGGSTLTVGGNLTNASFGPSTDGFVVGNGGMGQSSLVTVDGNFIGTGGATDIEGGDAAGVTGELEVAGAAPTTLTGTYQVTANGGTAILQYGTGNATGITQIGDGASNVGNLTLNGPDAYIELGDTNSNSALSHLATIANNGDLRVNWGDSVAIDNGLADNGQLQVDSSGNGGSTVTINGNVTDTDNPFGSGIQVGNGGGESSLLAINGTLNVTGPGSVDVNGGNAAGVIGKITVSGAAPSTLEGMYTVNRNAGEALLQYGSGEITQIGDGSSNQGQITLNGPDAFMESGGVVGNSALSQLGTIANNGFLHVNWGDSVTINNNLADNGQLQVDSSGAGGSTVTVNGNVTDTDNPFGFGIQVGGGGITSASLLAVNGTLNVSSAGSVGVYGGSSSAEGTLRVSDGVANAGGMNINAYGNVDVTGGNTYTQTAGSTVIDANGDLSATNVAVNGGVLQGDGTVTGDVYNGAVIAGGTGTQPGTLTITGNFTNNGTGEQASPFGNTTAGTVVSNLNPGASGSQQITVSGAVTLLGGTIQGNAVNGFNYTAGQAETVMNFAPGKLTGVFAGVQNGNSAVSPGTSIDLGNGLTLGVEYNNQAGNIQLVVANTPTAAETSDTWNGGTGNWGTASGWSQGTPSFYSNVAIGSTGSGSVTLGNGTTMQDATVESLTINSGNTLAYQATTPTSLSVGSTVTVKAGGALSLPTSGDQLELGGNFSNAGTTTLGAGAALATLGTVTNSGSGASLSVGNGASVTAYGGPTSLASVNGAGATLALSGGSLTAPGLTNAGTVSGNGSINLTDTDIANSGLVEASGGTLSVNGGGIQGTSGNITIDSGGTLDLSHATAGSTVATLSDSGSLNLGANSVTVSTDYDNTNSGTGNSFNKNANVTGSGQILASGNVEQVVTGADVSGGTGASPVLSFGNVHVGSSNGAAYAIENGGTSGPALRGAIQTSVNHGNITDASLSGNGVTAGNWGPVTTGASTSEFAVTWAPTAAGALSGQAVHLANNFNNVGEQTLSITGTAYALASPTITSQHDFNFGVVQAGSSYTDDLTVANVLPNGANAAYQEGLNATFGSSTNTQLTGSGSITNLAAGQSITGGSGTGMVVTLAPTSAGAIGGTITVNLVSNGETSTGSDGLGDTTLTADNLPYTWTFSGTVVNGANPSLTPNPMDFGNVRINSAQAHALSVENVAGTPPQASLDAQVGTLSGAATSNHLSSISGLAPGSTDDTSFVLGLNTGAAGAQSGTVAIDLQSDSTPNGCKTDCIVDLPTEDVAVSGNVYRLANPTLNTPTINLAARVGDPSPMAQISVTNTSADQYTEGLAATLGAAPAGFTSSGSIANLAAQGTDSASLNVGLNTTAAGTFTGTQAVNFVSNGEIDNATPEAVGSQNVALTGSVYTPAQATVNTASPVNFGIVHVGDGGGTLSKSISVTNSAQQTALNDTLQGSVATATSPFSGAGSLTGLTAGQTSTALGINLDTATAGVYNGTASLAFASHDSQLSDLQLAGATLGLQAQVNNFAKLAFSFGSGIGTLTQTGADSWTLNLGKLLQHSGGGTAASALAFLNAGGPAAYTDLLSSQGSISSGSGFTLAGDSVSDLAGDATQGNFDIGLSTLDTGAFNELLAFNVNSSNASGYDEDLGTVNLDLMGSVVGSVTPVPEPSGLGMFGAGLAALGGLLIFDRRRHGRKDLA